MLTGDDHHYARYQSDDGLKHKLTAGGGGAFLSATHHLRDPVKLDGATTMTWKTPTTT